MTSKIKVDNIENQCGGAVVTKCGGTTTISGTVVKSNTLQASDAGNIISQSGTTITLGASGDTINLASGASQSGFGRTGTVDWQTSIKTGDFTATSGEGYFVNTTSGPITVTLPASPSAGDIVSVKDYAQTFDTNNCTIGRNSQPIEGKTFDLALNTEGVAITLVYGDATKGWQSVNSNEVTNIVKFISATGGNTVTTSGDFKIHTFTGPGTFCVSQISSTPAENTVSYLVVAGGGGGRDDGGVPQGGAGGGGGGFRENKSPIDTYTASPLQGSTDVSITATAFPITVGAGGARQSNDGSNSIFSTVTSTGGGGGGVYNNTPGRSGGSGGGGGLAVGAGGAGNTPPVSPPQGNAGSPGTPGNPGAGGGAGAAGSGQNGGNGSTTSINATPTARAGGGASGRPGGSGGTGGGGNRTVAGGTNTGGGGGGGDSACSSAAGGSGIVIIRYKFQ